MTTECLNIINSLPTTDGQTDRKTDIATYRTAIAAKNHQCMGHLLGTKQLCKIRYPEPYQNTPVIKKYFT